MDGEAASASGASNGAGIAGGTPSSSAISSVLNRLDESFFAPVADLRLMSDWSPPEGREGGRYLNPRDGSSLEFKQHRPYGPGDDIRRVDWAVYGRTKKLFTRLVESEHTPELVIALDVSASMRAGGEAGKFGLAVEYALLIAFVALSSDYRVRIVPFGPAIASADAQGFVLVHPRQILGLAKARLSTWSSDGGTDFAALGQQALGWRARGASVVIISDFLTDVDDADLDPDIASGTSPQWFGGLSQEGRAEFEAARKSARTRILSSLDLLHQAFEPLDNPRVRASMLAITGFGERDLGNARSVFDLESGFLHRILFTRASERAYAQARRSHAQALAALAADRGMGCVHVTGRPERDRQEQETRRTAVRELIANLGFGVTGAELSATNLGEDAEHKKSARRGLFGRNSQGDSSEAKAEGGQR